MRYTYIPLRTFTYSRWWYGNPIYSQT